jgi:formamidopyrimidine-DNA glycosylase
VPELPDIALYLDALSSRILNQRLDRLTIKSPFLVRTVDPPIDAAEGRTVRALERMGKRIVLALDDDLFLVLHLMIAGRLLWKPPGAKPTGRIDLAAFAFPTGTLILTEAGTQKRASLHLFGGRGSLAAHDPGGLEVLGPHACTPTQFAAALHAVNRTLKLALTDPRTFSGIGNAYSDEILHDARLSPLKRTDQLTPDETSRLFESVQRVLAAWAARLRADFHIGTPKEKFPGVGDITAFRPDFAVHGKYGKPCPICGSPVQRIVYAENECNYCATCQTHGKVLADRSLSRLLTGDWPDRIEDWE